MKRMCIVWIAFTAVMTSACVMKSTYDAAVTELETTRADLEIAKEQKQLFVRQVTTLEETTKESTSEAEAAAAAVQQSREETETERKIGEEQIAKLKRTIAQLTGVGNSLRHALETAKQDAQALKSTVDMYKMKLRDGDGPRTPSFPPPIASPSEPGGTGPSVSASAQPPADSTTNQTMTSPGTATDTAATQPKPQPPTSRKPEPMDEGLLSTIKGWLVSLWRSVFS